MSDKNNSIDTASANDIEKGLPKPGAPKRSASDKLKQLDRKSLMFAGYIFWAVIFVAGGATTAALLTRKKPDSPTEAPAVASTPEPTPAPITPETPTATPTVSPSEAPTNSPTVNPLVSLHLFVLDEVETSFNKCERKGFDPSQPLRESYCENGDAYASSSALYKWKEGRYTFQEGVGGAESETAPIVQRPESVAITANRRFKDLKASNPNFHKQIHAESGVFTSRHYEDVKEDLTEFVNEVNDELGKVFPRTQNPIKLNKDCGFECFEDSLDERLEKLDVEFESIDNALKQLEEVFAGLSTSDVFPNTATSQLALKEDTKKEIEGLITVVRVKLLDF